MQTICWRLAALISAQCTAWSSVCVSHRSTLPTDACYCCCCCQSTLFNCRRRRRRAMCLGLDRCTGAPLLLGWTLPIVGTARSLAAIDRLGGPVGVERECESTPVGRPPPPLSRRVPACRPAECPLVDRCLASRRAGVRDNTPPVGWMPSRVAPASVRRLDFTFQRRNDDA